VRVVISAEPLATVLAFVIEPSTAVQDVLQEICPAIGLAGSPPRVHWEQGRKRRWGGVEGWSVWVAR